MDFDVVLRSWRARWVQVVGLVAACLIATAVWTYFTPPRYEATETLYVMATSRTGTAQELTQGQALVLSRLPSLTLLANSEIVLSGVIEDLGLDTDVETLSGQISADYPRDTSMLSITAVADTAPDAQALARATANRLTATSQSLEKAAGSPVATMTFARVRDALMPMYPVIPNRPLNLAIGAGIALLLGAAGVGLDAHRAVRRARVDAGSTDWAAGDDSGEQAVVRSLRPAPTGKDASGAGESAGKIKPRHKPATARARQARGGGGDE